MAPIICLSSRTVSDNAIVKVWLGLGKKTTWLGLEKDCGLG